MKIHIVRKLWDNTKVDPTKSGLFSRYKPPEILRAYIRRTSAEAYLLACRKEKSDKRLIRNYTFDIETVTVHDYRPPDNFFAKKDSIHGNSNYPFSETEGF